MAMNANMLIVRRLTCVTTEAVARMLMMLLMTARWWWQFPSFCFIVRPSPSSFPLLLPPFSVPFQTQHVLETRLWSEVSITPLTHLVFDSASVPPRWKKELKYSEQFVNQKINRGKTKHSPTSDPSDSNPSFSSGTSVFCKTRQISPIYILDSYVNNFQCKTT